MTYTATINWTKPPNELFTNGRYSRAHQWSFDGGMQLRASSSPGIVPPPMSDPALVDPEEAFIASLSSCHMLLFLSLCAKQKYTVVSYEDHAEGILGENEEGKKQMLSVTLNPIVCFEGDHLPSNDTIAHLHELAHEHCFIANSVKTKLAIRPQVTTIQQPVITHHT